MGMVGATCAGRRAALAAVIERWTGSPVRMLAEDQGENPERHTGEWLLVPYRRYLTVYVPFARQRYLPWDVAACHHGHALESSSISARSLRDRQR